MGSCKICLSWAMHNLFIGKACHVLPTGIPRDGGCAILSLSSVSGKFEFQILH